MDAAQTRFAIVLLALVLILGGLFIGYRATAHHSASVCYLKGVKYEPCP